MIGKCLALLCVTFGIAAGTCLQVPQVQYQLRSPVVTSPCVSAQVVSTPVVTSPCVSAQVVSTPVVSAPVVSAPVVQLSGNNVYSSGVIEGGVVSSGSIIAGEGPETAPLPVLQAPSVTLPAVEAPTVTLSNPPIPAPRVIGQRCICTKTVVKPQVIQRQVTVPKLQRYFKRTVTPIVENYTYKTRPVSSSQSTVAVAPAVATNSYGSRNTCYSRVC